jgi:hypothetical protein
MSHSNQPPGAIVPSETAAEQPRYRRSKTHQSSPLPCRPRTPKQGRREEQQRTGIPIQGGTALAVARYQARADEGGNTEDEERRDQSGPSSE